MARGGGVEKGVERCVWARSEVHGMTPSHSGPSCALMQSAGAAALASHRASRVPCLASSQGHAMADAVLKKEDIAWHARRTAPTWKEAHDLLTWMRDTNGQTIQTRDYHNLTNYYAFDWKAWIANRPDAEQIVGEGVWAFVFVWTRHSDSNRHEARGDFMVRRTDSSDVRLHPQQRKNNHTGLHEAIPVWGKWEFWKRSGTAAEQHEAYPGPAAPPSLLDLTTGASTSSWSQDRTLAYHGISQADKVGKRAAAQYLDRILTAWMERPHPRGRFRRDITTTGEFEWASFFQGRSWYKQWFEPHDRVSQVEVAWHRSVDKAVFVIHKSDGSVWTVTVTPTGDKFSFGDYAEERD